MGVENLPPEWTGAQSITHNRQNRVLFSIGAFARAWAKGECFFAMKQLATVFALSTIFLGHAQVEEYVGLATPVVDGVMVRFS